LLQVYVYLFQEALIIPRVNPKEKVMLNLSALKSPLLRAAIALSLAVLLLSSNALPRAQAAAGDLDPTFGSGGKVTTDFFGFFDSANAVAIQSDGRIVAGGSSGNSVTGGDFALTRYNTDGSVDTSFGAAGKVITDFGGSIDQALALAVQNDQKIVAAGFTAIPQAETS